MDPTTGPTAERRVAGRYRLEAVLGRGGMGVVWAAEDELLGRPVAVKEVLAAQGLTPDQVAEARRRTVQEARTAARLSSPAAVLVLDVVEEDGEPWVVMERLAPRTLADVLNERGRLSAHEVATLGLRLLDALDAAHAAGVLHRDIKPGNVMFRGQPEPRNAVLTDFGIARLLGDPTTTATGMVLGSPAFVAPERARGDRATPASDLWALGVTLWIAAEGVSPFAREGALPTLTAVLTADPPPLRYAEQLTPALTGLLSKDPDKRLDARLLRALLERSEAADPAPPATASVARTLPPSAPPSAPATGAPATEATTTQARVVDAPAARSGRRARPAVVAALAALLVAGAAGAAVINLRSDRTSAGPATTPSQSASSGLTAGAGPATTAGTAASTSTSSTPTTASTTAATTTEAPTSRTSSTSSASTRETASSSDSASSSAGAGAVPAGMRRYTDRTGFSVAVPRGWRVEHRGQRVYLRDPSSAAYLLVDQTTNPAADPVADWRAQERVVSRRLPGYRLVRIDPVTVGSWRGADWEFTHGRGTHVLNRNLVTGRDRAYALYWSAPDQGWDDSEDRLRQVLASFRPRT